ncbi:coenzyme F420-0:L-glutamate ligase [Candidatus Nitrososphaera sp. FF02]|uniref:coenzyme F420-0:L-glutamate ligase n=1 Tax=Candidatus Nitrososphaera sp. FF02 TaxID=3398226 RepID=UPI0039EAD847
MLSVIPVKLAGDIRHGDDIGSMILKKIKLQGGDIIVVAQKAVSKAEGRVVHLEKVRPSRKAARLARELKKDPRVVQLILDEAKEIVLVKNGIIITETWHGLVCANSGVDQSNLADENAAVLLPKNPDGIAKKMRSFFKEKSGRDVAVVITDTFGRPFREGQTNVAIGVAGIKPIRNYIGRKDMFGKKLHVTEIAVADEIASAAELVMNKSDGVPVAVVRGYAYEKDEHASLKRLLRGKKTDLFRHVKT